MHNHSVGVLPFDPWLNLYYGVLFFCYNYHHKIVFHKSKLLFSLKFEYTDKKDKYVQILEQCYMTKW